MELIEDEMLIIKQVKELSSIFLKDMGGFYPFAFGMDSDQQIVSIAASDGTEFPDSQDLIDLLEKSLPINIKKGKYILTVICIDISVNNNVDGVITKQDAIQMRFISPTYRKTLHLFYELDSDNNVTFKDLLGISTVMLEDLN